MGSDLALLCLPSFFYLSKRLLFTPFFYSALLYRFPFFFIFYKHEPFISVRSRDFFYYDFIFSKMFVTFLLLFFI